MCTMQYFEKWYWHHVTIIWQLCPGSPENFHIKSVYLISYFILIMDTCISITIVFDHHKNSMNRLLLVSIRDSPHGISISFHHRFAYLQTQTRTNRNRTKNREEEKECFVCILGFQFIVFVDLICRISIFFFVFQIKKNSLVLTHSPRLSVNTFYQHNHI